MEAIVRFVTKNLMRSGRYFVSSKCNFFETFGYTESIHSVSSSQLCAASSAHALRFSARRSASPSCDSLSSKVSDFHVESSKVLRTLGPAGQHVRSVTTRIKFDTRRHSTPVKAAVSGRGSESLGSELKNKVLKSGLGRPEIQATGHPVRLAASVGTGRHWQRMPDSPALNKE